MKPRAAHRGWHVCAALLLSAACTSIASANNAQAQPERPWADPYPAQWLDDSGLFTPRFGSVEFMARDGNQLRALTYRSTGFDPKDGPVWFIMHGASRAAERYIETAAPAAERYNALALVIHFPKHLYPSSSDYTLGVTTRGKADALALEEGRWRRPEEYLYSEVEHVFEATRVALRGEQPGYYLFGHSAGAQFTHRLMTFLPDARVLGAVAANAGWYTLPVSGSGRAYTMPYGLRATPLSEDELRVYLNSPLAILVGERDIATPATSSMVRGTREAMLQGKTRRARGAYFFELGESQGKALATEVGWRIATVPGASHSARKMIDSAAFFLFAPDEAPCSASSANDSAGLVLTEILADPPQGMQGDANGDGERDSQADEFVELANTGTTAICLAGWTLGDASEPERHVVPLGRALAPGATLIVFGGGIPTGSFGGAEVQQAAFDGRLNLNNDGDVLTLRDPGGNIAAQLSWGNCAHVRCAKEHLDYELGINESIVRRPDETGTWVRHSKIAEAAFSPGIAFSVKTDNMAKVSR